MEERKEQEMRGRMRKGIKEGKKKGTGGIVKNEGNTHTHSKIISGWGREGQDVARLQGVARTHLLNVQGLEYTGGRTQGCVHGRMYTVK